MQGLEQQVLALHFLPPHQGVHEGRFTHVRIPYQRHHRVYLPSSLLPLLRDLSQPTLIQYISPDFGLAVSQSPPLHLQLRLPLAPQRPPSMALLGADDFHSRLDVA